MNGIPDSKRDLKVTPPPPPPPKKKKKKKKEKRRTNKRNNFGHGKRKLPFQLKYIPQRLVSATSSGARLAQTRSISRYSILEGLSSNSEAKEKKSSISYELPGTRLTLL